MSSADKLQLMLCSALSSSDELAVNLQDFGLIHNQRYLLEHSSVAEELIKQLYYVFLRFNNGQVAATQLF